MELSSNISTKLTNLSNLSARSRPFINQHQTKKYQTSLISLFRSLGKMALTTFMSNGHNNTPLRKIPDSFGNSIQFEVSRFHLDFMLIIYYHK